MSRRCFSQTVAIAKISHVPVNPGLGGAIFEISVGDTTDRILCIARRTSQVPLPPLPAHRLVVPAFCLEENSRRRCFPPVPPTTLNISNGCSDEWVKMQT